MKRNSYIYTLEKVKTYLEQLPIDEQENAIWDILHQARWHKGIDWVRWVDENKTLIEKITAFNYFVHCPEELKKEVWDSILKLKEINR